MLTWTHKSLRPLLLVTAIYLGASVAAQADQIVWQTNFQSPTGLGSYATGADVGNPDSLHVAAGTVSVVADPCVTAGGSSQCLQFALNPELFSNLSFGPGNYGITLSMAGGTSTREVLVGLGSGDFNVPTVSANTPFTNYQHFVTIPVSESAHLQISSSGSSGILINSITVTQLDTGASPVPEPSSGALMTTAGLGLLGVAARQRSTIHFLSGRSFFQPKQNGQELLLER